jgi:hypothetical protein
MCRAAGARDQSVHDQQTKPVNSVPGKASGTGRTEQRHGRSACDQLQNRDAICSIDSGTIIPCPPQQARRGEMKRGPPLSVDQERPR